MASPFGSAPEKLTVGVQTLVTHPGSIKERLLDAYIDNVQYVKPENVPEDYRRQLRQLHEIMEGANLPEGPTDPRKGTIEHAVKLMTADDAMDVARAIFSLYDCVIHALYEKNQEAQ
jgi:hypothetical protein